MTKQETETSNRNNRIALIVVLIIFMLLLILVLIFSVKPKEEIEEPTQEITETQELAMDAIEKGMIQVESNMRQKLSDMGFESKIPVDTWFYYDQYGLLRYTSQVRYSNLWVDTGDAYDTSKYKWQEPERILIGNEQVGNPNDYRTNEFITQAEDPNNTYYVEEVDDKHVIFVDPKTNTTYRSTYILQAHAFQTEELNENYYDYISHI